MNRVVTFDVLGTLFSLTTPPRLHSIGLYEPRHASLRSRTAARSRRRRSLEQAKLHDRFERVFSVSDMAPSSRTAVRTSMSSARAAGLATQPRCCSPRVSGRGSAATTRYCFAYWA
jgi:hypothetical protein